MAIGSSTHIDRRFERPGPGSRTSTWDQRFRQRLRRRAWAPRLAVLGLIAVTTVSLARPIAGGDARPDRAESHLMAVHVAARDLKPGEVISSDDVRPVEVDEALVPPRAATQTLGASVASKILEGEVVHEARLGSTGRLGLGPHERAVALKRPLASLPLETGDVVDLLAIVAGGPNGATNHQIGTGRVVAADDDQIVVAVPAELAAPLLEYQAIGTVELALTPWGTD